LQQLDAEEWRDLIAQYQQAASGAVGRFGGHVAMARRRASFPGRAGGEARRPCHEAAGPPCRPLGQRGGAPRHLPSEMALPDLTVRSNACAREERGTAVSTAAGASPAPHTS
jgi:hypothetical protein